MTQEQRETIESERRIEKGTSQRALAREIKNSYVITLADVPLATVYNHIRRFDKRNATTRTAGLQAVSSEENSPF